MPEAPVDEDHDARRAKDNVGSAAPISEDWSIDAKPESAGVERSPECDLRLRVAPTNTTHPHPSRSPKTVRPPGLRVPRSSSHPRPRSTRRDRARIAVQAGHRVQVSLDVLDHLFRDSQRASVYTTIEPAGRACRQFVRREPQEIIEKTHGLSDRPRRTRGRPSTALPTPRSVGPSVANSKLDIANGFVGFGDLQPVADPRGDGNANGVPDESPSCATLSMGPLRPLQSSTLTQTLVAVRHPGCLG